MDDTMPFANGDEAEYTQTNSLEDEWEEFDDDIMQRVELLTMALEGVAKKAAQG